VVGLLDPQETVHPLSLGRRHIIGVAVEVEERTPGLPAAMCLPAGERFVACALPFIQVVRHALWTHAVQRCEQYECDGRQCEQRDGQHGEQLLAAAASLLLVRLRRVNQQRVAGLADLAAAVALLFFAHIQCVERVAGLADLAAPAAVVCRADGDLCTRCVAVRHHVISSSAGSSCRAVVSRPILFCEQPSPHVAPGES